MEGFTCLDCGNYHEDYADLKHYSHDSGGFCRGCGGSSFIADSEREDDDAEL